MTVKDIDLVSTEELAEIKNLDNATVIGSADTNIAPKKSFDHSGR